MEAARSRPEVLVQVGLEYRYIPAVAKLIEQVKIGSIGHVRMVSIREHRFPFLVKVKSFSQLMLCILHSTSSMQESVRLQDCKSNILYQGRNHFEGLPGFKGPVTWATAKAGPDPKRGSFPNMMNLFKFQKSNETKGICKTEYIG
jgi:hypothetical protein